MIAVQGDTEAIAIFWDADDPLQSAAYRGDIAAIIALLDAGADPNGKNTDVGTPLHLAAIRGHQAAVAALLGAGADPNRKNSGGLTPLHWAAGGGHRAVIAALLDAGADPNGKDRGGNTPLHWAAIRGHPAAITALLDAGADPNVKDDAGLTPLHWAAGGGHRAMQWFAASTDPFRKSITSFTVVNRRFDRGHPAAITALLDAGADPNVKDNEGHTPLEWAANANPKAMDVLRARMGLDEVSDRR